MSATIFPFQIGTLLTAFKVAEGVVNVVTDASGNGTVSVVVGGTGELFGSQIPRVLVALNGAAGVQITGVISTVPPGVQAVVGTAVPVGTVSVIVRNGPASGTVQVSIFAYSRE